MKTVLLIVVLCSCVSSIAGQLGGLATGFGNIAGPLLALGLLGGLTGLGGNRRRGQDFLIFPERQQTFAHQQPLAFYGRPYWLPSKFCNNKKLCGQFSLAL